MTLQTQTIDYLDGDTKLEGFFAFESGCTTPLPIVLIAHAWGGRDPFVCNKAEQLARLGYAAFALDMYGKGVLGNTIEEKAQLMQPWLDNRMLLQRRMTAALNRVRELDVVDATRVAAIGFCFGGLCVLDLARSGVDIQGVVSFHGLLAPPDNTPRNAIKSKVLMLHGHDDPMASTDQVMAIQQELSAAGADWQLHSYGHTMHAFTNPQANDPALGTVYQADADRRSWLSMKNFLAEVLAPA